MLQQHRRQRRARITRTVTLVASLAVIVWFLFIRGGIPDAIAGHELEHFDTFRSESQAGQLHTDQPVQYPMDPPVSGQHAPNAADCGTYDTQLPNETMVHALEHGSVGILYSPDAPLEEIKRAEEIVNDYPSHVFSEPYAEMEDPFTIVAWAHMMRLDSFDEEAITEFIEVFREGGDAPEEQDCAMASDSRFEPTPTGSPTPGATATVTPAESPEKKEKNKD